MAKKTKRPDGMPRVWTLAPKHVQKAEESVRLLLSHIGEDPDRGGLKETPKRFVKALLEMTEGYTQDPTALLKCFDDGAEGYDEIVLVRDIPFWSTCEHHLAPFFGVAHVGYIPVRRIVGLSKLARVVDVYARRLQVQERMTAQVADVIEKVLKPKGVGVVIEARHCCMECRGVRKANATTTTSALRGVFRTKPAARAEFLSLALRRGK